MNKNEILKVYGTDYKDMTKRLLAASNLAGIIANRKEKLRIGIKPNLVSPTPAEFGATTHPEVVAGIIEYLQENCKAFTESLTIIEGSWIGDKTSDAFEYCGYNALAEHYGVKIVDTQKDTSTTENCNDMEIRICDCVKNVDFLINVPVLKGHCQTKITCALKNMKGLIPNSEKRLFHKKGLHNPIAHLNAFLQQDFIVIDHICGDPDFEDGGHPLVKNCVMTAMDPVLVDAYVCSILGYETSDVPYIGLAAELGVGNKNLEDAHIIVIEGDNSEDMPKSHRILEISYGVEEIDSCSACYGMLMDALDRLAAEGLLDKLEDKICIGQGYRGKNGKLGVGNCTKDFDVCIEGCPPEAEDIYNTLKKICLEK